MDNEDDDTDSFAVGLFYPCIALSFLLGAVCLVFNALTFSFYKRKSKETLSLMYSALSLCDMAAGVSAILSGVALWMILAEHNTNTPNWGNPYHRYFNCVSAFVTSMTSHLSVFYNAVLMVVKTINIMLPFYQTRNGPLKLSFVIYGLLWVVITAAHVILNFHEEDENVMLIMTPVVGSHVVKAIFNKDSIELKAAVTVFIPYVIPAVICVVCFIIQAYKLLSTSVGNRGLNRRITITILYLSGVYIICNTLFFATAIVYVIMEKKRILLIIIISHFTGNILPFINSAVNPLILIARGKDLQKFARRCLGLPPNVGAASINSSAGTRKAAAVIYSNSTV